MWEWLIATAACCILWIISNILHHEQTENYKHEQIPIYVISDHKSCILYINKLLSHSPLFVGIDCEWKSCKNDTTTNKIALLQIAHSSMILLIRLHLFHFIPLQLFSFLNNVKILKCGVGIYGDKSKLFRDYNATISGCVDLNDLITNENHHYLSLEKLSKMLLQKNMKYKNCNMDHSKWESRQLTKTQILYAADDALVGYLLFDTIMKQQHINQIKSGETYLEIVYGKIDCIFTKSTHHKTRPHIMKSKSNKRWSRRLTYKRYGYATKILDVNGDVLTLCSANLKRYLLQNEKAKSVYNIEAYFTDKNKDVEGHNLYVIQLLNEPETVQIDNNNINDYCRSINVTELECYICGAEKDLTRCFLIPKNYPKYIHCAKKIHYAVPICLGECQPKVFKWRHLMQETLIDQYKLRLMDDVNVRKRKMKKQLRIYALTLLKQRKRYQVSVQIQNKWIQQILAYFNVENVENIRIKECDINKEIGIDWYQMNDYNYIVIKYFMNELANNHNKVNHRMEEELIKLYELFRGKEIEFIEIWRKDFMRAFQPKKQNKQFETFQIFCTNFDWQS